MGFVATRSKSTQSNKGTPAEALAITSAGKTRIDAVETVSKSLRATRLLPGSFVNTAGGGSLVMVAALGSVEVDAGRSI